jgi:hypothetical protein
MFIIRLLPKFISSPFTMVSPQNIDTGIDMICW